MAGGFVSGMYEAAVQMSDMREQLQIPFGTIVLGPADEMLYQALPYSGVSGGFALLGESIRAFLRSSQSHIMETILKKDLLKEELLLGLRLKPVVQFTYFLLSCLRMFSGSRCNAPLIHVLASVGLSPSSLNDLIRYYSCCLCGGKWGRVRRSI